MSAPIPRPGIMDIAAYVGGESKLPGVDRVMKLSSNEGALGPSPKVIDALANASQSSHRYPDGGAVETRNAIGKFWGLDPARIVCGAGSDELLGLLVKAYVGPGDEVLYPEHGFLMYAIAAKTCGATPVTAAEVNLTAHVDNLLAAVTERTKIVFVANPSNPTGTYLSASEMQRLRAGLRDDILLVIDAAYAEFVGHNDYSAGVEMVDAHDNVVMTRTFSKIFALGGLRLGWAYCPAGIADVLNRIRNPFNVSSAALVAGQAAMEDPAYLELCRDHNTYWRAWLQDGLTKLGLETTPSVCNFVLAKFPNEQGRDAVQADRYLRSCGIIVRRVASYGLADWLRITVGTGEENQAVMAALTKFLKG